MLFSYTEMENSMIETNIYRLISLTTDTIGVFALLREIVG
ncbi:hypothetical protein Metal_2238 [Methylomicrobium album BG8]|uniref:Uncharacterized protein n=1 Tax=Methylomicrobium album BG8 TaxID=686340 RepID=H8GG60_METAL|nr:hypothetical protein Metal_2238 [Methylomicrobium album BG8]